MSTTQSTPANGSTTRVTKQSDTPTQRQLKVRESRYDYQANQQPNQRTEIGEILIKGKWLIEAGFSVHAKVTIQIEDGRLVLTAD